MRDYDSERAKPSVTRTYGDTTRRGPIKPYNELLFWLGDCAKELADQDRKALQRLAWALGERGEVHACEVIMEFAAEPEPKQQHYMYGYYGPVSGF